MYTTVISMIHTPNMYRFIIFYFLIINGLYAQTNEKLIVKEKVDVLSSLTREPMVAEHPNGDFYVTGYENSGISPKLWKSTDQGKSWIKLDTGTLEQGADGNSDVDLIIDKDGVIYLLSMKYTRIPEEVVMEDFDFSTMKGEHIVVGVSRDEGITWEWTYLSQNDYDDRPWIEIASDGSVHVIWNDGKGIHYSTSTNQGKTWEQQADIFSKGGSSHFAAGPNGQLAVRVVPMSASGFAFDEGVDLIRLSLDNGKSWQDVDVPGTRTWSEGFDEQNPRWVEPIQWDEKGSLYYLWSEEQELKLGISENNGQDWKTYLVTSSENRMYFPFLNIQNGKMTCTWVSGFEENLRHHAAILTLENDELIVSELEPQKIAELQSRYGLSPTLGTGGEYFPIITLSDGDFGMITTIQNYKDNRLGFTWWRLGLE